MNNLSQFSRVKPDELLSTLDLWEVPIDLDAICKKLNISVKRSAVWDKDYSGQISVDENKNIKIWINSFDSKNRQRFTLAHEIGHLVNDLIPALDDIDSDKEFIDTELTLNRDGRQDPREYKANDYAARLLMPKSLIISHGKKTISKLKNILNKDKVPFDKFLSTMAVVFEVSEQAMEIRLKNLGVIKT